VVVACVADQSQDLRLEGGRGGGTGQAGREESQRGRDLGPRRGSGQPTGYALYGHTEAIAGTADVLLQIRQIRIHLFEDADQRAPSVFRTAASNTLLTKSLP
jgi:hypothetical protein